MDKVWVVKLEEEMDCHDSIVDDKVYLSEDRARKVAEDMNRGNAHKPFYVDYLDVD